MVSAPQISDAIRFAAHNLALSRELVLICQALSRAGVRHVVLKGIPLLRRLDFGIDLWSLSDNDILVEPAAIESAVVVLSQIGYGPAEGHSLAIDRLLTNQYPMFRSLTDGTRIYVELHWRAFSPLCFDVPDSLVWRHVEPFSFEGVEIEVLDDELTLVHTAAHYVQHAFGYFRILRTLARAWSLWSELLDTSSLERLARSTGVWHSLAYCLRAARALELTSANVSFQSTRAALLELLLPAKALEERRPNPDYERIVLSWLLLPARSVAKQLRYAALPPVALLGKQVSQNPTRISAEYLRRARRGIVRWRAFRTERRGGFRG